MAEGVSRRLRSPGGSTPLSLLHKAISEGDLEGVREYFDEHPGQVNSGDEQGFTAFSRAAFANQVEVCKFLRDKLGANVNATTHSGWSSLMICCEKNRGFTALVKLLLFKWHARTELRNSGGCTALFLAATSGHREIVRMILKKTKEVDTPSQDGWSPLLCCAEHNKRYYVIARMLLEKGADPNHRNREHVSTLYLSAVSGFIDFVELLFEFGADPNIEERHGWRPLHAAVEKGHIRVVQRILEHEKANVNVRNSLGFTACYLAARFNNPKMLRFLLENGADSSLASENGWTPILGACQKDMGHIECVKILLEHGADPSSVNSNGVGALYLASYSNHVDILKLLLDSGADITQVDDKGWSVLIPAVQNGHYEAAELLLGYDEMDVNAQTSKGTTAIYLACLGGSAKLSRLLIRKGADVNRTTTDGWTPLMALCSRDSKPETREELVRMLLVAGADVNATKKDGVTSIYLAALNGYVSVGNLLLKSGAATTIVDRQGWTPLMVAASSVKLKGTAEIARLIMEQEDCDLNAVNVEGLTALYLSCCHSNVEVARNLIEKGCNIDLQNKFNWSPLMLASWENRKEMVDLLIESGANVNLRMPNGLTSLFWAAMKGWTGVVRALLAVGAEVEFEAPGIDVTTTCLNSHQLEPFISEQDNLFCTFCGRSYAKGHRFMRCKECNFGTCTVCVDSKHSPVLSALEYAQTNGLVEVEKMISFAWESDIARRLRDLNFMRYVWKFYDEDITELAHAARLSLADLKSLGIPSIDAKALFENFASERKQSSSGEMSEAPSGSRLSISRLLKWIQPQE